MKDVYQFYLAKEEPYKSCLLALRSIILQQDAHITETLKYGMPCFCYKNKAICYLWTDKKTHNPYLLMVEGKQLPFSELEQGNRSRMKVLNINPHTDLHLNTIEKIIKAAILLCKK